MLTLVVKWNKKCIQNEKLSWEVATWKVEDAEQYTKINLTYIPCADSLI
jgi:hypothetical protein